MSSHVAAQADLYSLLKRPVVTEKTTTLAEFNQYVFEVVKGANKIQLAQAFELAFPGRKVKSVRMVKIPSQFRRRNGRKMGVTQEKRKAIFSIEGEPIELFTGV